MTEVAKLALVWFFLSLAFAIGLARWLKWLRDSPWNEWEE